MPNDPELQETIDNDPKPLGVDEMNPEMQAWRERNWGKNEKRAEHMGRTSDQKRTLEAQERAHQKNLYKEMDKTMVPDGEVTDVDTHLDLEDQIAKSEEREQQHGIEADALEEEAGLEYDRFAGESGEHRSDQTERLPELSKEAQELMGVFYDLRDLKNDSKDDGAALESFLDNTFYNGDFLVENRELASELFQEVASLPSTRFRAVEMVDRMLTVNRELALDLLGQFISDEDIEIAESAAEKLYELAEKAEIDIKTEAILLYAKRAERLKTRHSL